LQLSHDDLNPASTLCKCVSQVHELVFPGSNKWGKGSKSRASRKQNDEDLLKGYRIHYYIAEVSRLVQKP
jgi:hypothetical protein